MDKVLMTMMDYENNNDHSDESIIENNLCDNYDETRVSCHTYEDDTTVNLEDDDQYMTSVSNKTTRLSSLSNVGAQTTITMKSTPTTNFQQGKNRLYTTKGSYSPATYFLLSSKNKTYKNSHFSDFVMLLTVTLLVVLVSPFTMGASTSSFYDHDVNTSPRSIHLEANSIVVRCETSSMKIKIPSPHPYFSGMVYPQGLSKNSSCLREYLDVDNALEYELPLRSCNTMQSNVADMEEEYFNTIILEPHPKLVTGFGKGFHVRCKYRKTEPYNLPPVSMNILKDGVPINTGRHKLKKDSGVTELEVDTIKIGDPLEINIVVHSNDTEQFTVTDCHVRDGLGWAEQVLVNSEGCPVDQEIMPPFAYIGNTATVHFSAHKFPYSPSVYYDCSVRFCNDCVAPICDGAKNVLAKKQHSKRDAAYEPQHEASIYEQPATIQVYNGLWVNEEEDDPEAEEVRRKEANGEILCFNQRDFALAIAFTGLFLMIAVLLIMFLLCLRRRRSIKGSESGSSSIYSGGYTNTAYSHSST